MNNPIKQNPVSGVAGSPIKQEDLTSTISSDEAKTLNISEPEKEKQSPSAGSAISELPKTGNLSNISAKSMICGNLPESIYKKCEQAKEIIHNANKFSDLLDPQILFKTAERLIAFQSWVVNYLLSSESLYREKRADLIRNGASAAAAEAEAKSSDEYRAYRYIQYIYDIAESQILLVKKFSDKLQQEFKNS